MLRAGTAGVASALIAAGCRGGPSTPASPTALVPVTPAMPSRCTPPTAARVHTVPVPGSSTPVTVWIEGTSPPPGATVRAGDLAQVSYGHFTPSGFTTVIHVVIGDAPTRGAFMSITTGGCGGGTSTTPLPRVSGPLQIWLRLWVYAGSHRPGDPLPDTSRPPDYEASEPVLWTIVP